MIQGILDMDRERLLDVLFNTIEDGLLILDREFSITLANKWMERRYSSRMPLSGKKCYAVLHDRHERCTECGYARALVTGKMSTHAMRSSSDLDPTGWFEISVYPLKNADGGVMGAVEHVRDVTERKQAEELLKDEAIRRRILVDGSRDGIVVLDLNGNVYEANQAYARMLGYSIQEIHQLHIWDWDTQFDKETLLQMIADLDNDGAHFETSHRRKDGTVCAVEISTNGAICGGQKLVFAVCRDITEKKALEAQIRELAIRDPLTDVYNRRHIFERLTEIVAERVRTGNDFCVSILDLDHFKVVNDTQGHLAGDFVLKEFATAFSSLVRPYDLFGRYGGEEFIVVSKNAGAEETAAMIERVMSTVRNKTFAYEGREIRLTFSCGLAESSEFAPDELSIETLVARADRRLYEAKAAGRNCCVAPPRAGGLADGLVKVWQA